MKIKIIVKNIISNYNPFAIFRRNKMRNNLKNTDFSFLCPNCIGGMILHDLNIPFNSPTVNLMIHQKEFVKFILDLDYYINQNLVFYKDTNYECPCAKLGKENKEIIIHFTHYKSEIEARQCWERRINRINYQNMFVFLMEKDGLSKLEIEQLKDINVRGLVVFTAHEYSNIPYTCYVKKYKKNGSVGNILVRSYLNDKKEYENYFNFVKWFNEADGEDYNCRPFILKNKI